MRSIRSIRNHNLSSTVCEPLASIREVLYAYTPRDSVTTPLLSDLNSAEKQDSLSLRYHSPGVYHTRCCCTTVQFQHPLQSSKLRPTTYLPDLV